MHPYHRVRGATVIFGYVNEEGVEVPVRSLPAEFMDSVKLKNQLRQIREQYCTENAKDYKAGEDTSPRGKAARTLTAQDKKHNKKADKKAEEDTKYVLEEGHRSNAKKLHKLALDRMAVGDSEGNKRLRKWADHDAQKYVDGAVLPGGKNRRQMDVYNDQTKPNIEYLKKKGIKWGPKKDIKEEGGMKDALERSEGNAKKVIANNKKKMTADAQDRANRWKKAGKVSLKESADGPSLESAIHSYSLPPHEGGDDDWSHHHYVHKVDKHFKQHLDLHGVGNQLTNKERQYALAHRHLSSRGHIAASMRDIAHCTEKSSGLIKHAREKLTNAVHGPGHEAPEHKYSSILMHKVNGKIQDDHERRAREQGRDALNTVSRGGIYE